MKMIAKTAAAAVLCAAIAPAAHAATACSVVGTWKDSYGYTATFTTNKTGTATVSAICSKPYKLTTTKLTAADWNISGKSTDTSCPAVKATLTFAKGSCTSASGKLAAGGESLNDTFTKESTAAFHRAPTADDMLTNGLK